MAAVAHPALGQAAKRSIKQVQIQVWISETSERGLRDLGTNLNYTRVVRGVDQSGSVERISANVFDPTNPQFAVTLPAPDDNPFPDNLRPDLSDEFGGVQTQSGAGLTFSIIDAGRGTLEGVFRGIDQTADVDLISKPEILVIDNEEAEIRAGGKVPFQGVKYDNKGMPQLDVVWEDIGVNMKLKPTILSDDLLQLNITKLNVTDIADIVSLRGLDLPVFSQRSQEGVVLVPNGQTLVIGGLSSRVVRRSELRVPVVGKLPIIGMLFRARRSEVETRHLLIFVSPTIVDLRDLKPKADSALNFWREEQWSHMDEIKEEIEAMEEEL